MSPDDTTVAVPLHASLTVPVGEHVEAGDVIAVTDTDPIDEMSERELLVYIAKNVREAVTLIEQGVGALGPLLDNPKLKLGMKMFGL